jgi:hypothetical protein
MVVRKVINVWRNGWCVVRPQNDDLIAQKDAFA